MKRFIPIALALILVVGLLASCGAPASQPAPPAQPSPSGDAPAPEGDAPAPEGDMPELVIGLFQPATGANGAGGRQESLGTIFANYRHPYVDIGGVTHRVRVEQVDNQSSTAHGPAAAADLVARGIHFVLGSYGSAVSMASSDVFRDAGLIAMGVSCTNPGVTRGNDHYFRVCFLDPFQGQVLASLAANTLNADTAFILSLLGDDYSQGLSNFFREAFEANGGTVIQENFPEGTSDFTAFMNNARAQGAEVIFAPTSVEAAALIISAADIVGVGIPLLAGDTWDSPQVVDAARGRNVEVMVTTFYQEGGAPEWDADFKAWLNANPTQLANNGGTDIIAGFTAMGYDAYMLALDIFHRAGTLDDREAILQATWDTSFIGPVAGLIEFNEYGDARRNTAFVKMVDYRGVWEFYAEQSL
ncbi:MAG: ABC transporter substrate-binding protein [Oscillospiraceae bacterium]|nr:ABC transporter substrate-binding protein [Oscillospiraceae bacterium]